MESWLTCVTDAFSSCLRARRPERGLLHRWAGPVQRTHHDHRHRRQTGTASPGAGRKSVPPRAKVWDGSSGEPPTVLRHAGLHRIGDAERRRGTRRLGRGPRVQRSAGIHHRRSARCRGSRVAGQGTCRHPLQRAAMAPPALDGQSRSLRCPQGRCRPRPPDRGRPARCRRRAHSGQHRGSPSVGNSGSTDRCAMSRA
jgi:hypothetical protein